MVKNYGVLKGQALRLTRDADSDPHSEVLIRTSNGKKYRIAINVRSNKGATAQQRWVEYLVVENLKHPIVVAAGDLKSGWTDLRGHPAAIDYLRSNMFRAQDFRALPATLNGPDNDLFEKVEALIDRAIRDPKAVVYAFGESWDEDKADPYFHFTPGAGVHDIHMNQGEPGAKGTFQDGALLVQWSDRSFTGLFLKFQSQSWHTSEEDGTAIADAPASRPPQTAEDGSVSSWEPVADNSPYRLARIVGALINPVGDDQGRETVTILNTTTARLDIEGWKILDASDRAEPLNGIIEPGATLTVHLSGRQAQLGNKGGTISLLDKRGLKVDGVAYTAREASREGVVVAF